MLSLVPLLIAAATVGILHMSAPDHWVTLSVLSRNSQWSRPRILGVSLATASGHVVLSVILGLTVVFVGLVFSRLVSLYLDAVIGLVMVVVGLFVGIRPLVAKEREGHRAKDEFKISEDRSLSKEISYFAVLGAALSPDLSITPVFLAAIPAGLDSALELSLVFAVASILTLVFLVQVGTAGLARAFERIPEKYNDSLVGFVIAIIGVYVLLWGATIIVWVVSAFHARRQSIPVPEGDLAV
jgi:nickel/cobalt exporter